MQTQIPFNHGENLLPYDGEVLYLGPIFGAEEALEMFRVLEETVRWTNDVVHIFGKTYVTARKVAWYGDREFSYAYSGHNRVALPWTNLLKELKAKAEGLSDCSFNSCLLNLYHEGNEGMGWHSDDESSLVPEAAIASLSFGAQRRFAFRHKETREKRECLLENGSLLVMKGQTQTAWQHSLPKTSKPIGPRINLTFRLMK